MAALTGINVIQGKPSPSPELMRALLHRAGHRLRVVENTSEACEVQLVRSDDPEHVHTERFTIGDAQRAGIAGGANWGKYPARMLLARATGNAVKTHAPDVLLGMTVLVEGDDQPYAPDGPTANLETGEVPEEPQEPRLRHIPVEDTPDDNDLSEDVAEAEVVEDDERPFEEPTSPGEDEAKSGEVVEEGVAVDRDVLIEELRNVYQNASRNLAEDFKAWRGGQGFPARADRMTDAQLIDCLDWWDRRNDGGSR